VFRSTSVRLAALYTFAFALSVVLLGATTLFTTRAALTKQFDARIEAEAFALTQEDRAEGLTGVLQAVRERDSAPGELAYGLDGPKGERLAGRLAGSSAPPGWSNLKLSQPRSQAVTVRVLMTRLPDGYHLVVGDDYERIEDLQHTVLLGFIWAFAGVVVLGIAGGYGLSRGVHRRLAAISGAAEAIIDGDLARRVPVGGSGDDVDRLALTFNRMLDRIAALMEGLRQVSTDVAHDLRTPLTRLRQRLEASRALDSTHDRAAAIEGALGDLDAILVTFAALLRIAQIEGGARRAAFRPTDLGDIARTVVDAFAPSAEDAGQSLQFDGEDNVIVEGDRELLTQMLANLVENALRHGGERVRVMVRATNAPSGAVLSVSDDGPGVPRAERARLFDRFYRLERSRSTPGSGLGLALVAAVSSLHQSEVALGDAGPGLDVHITFPGRA
jgi:signal transduction histidine kinase